MNFILIDLPLFAAKTLAKKVSILINTIVVLLILLYAWYNNHNDFGVVYSVLFYLILVAINLAILISLIIFNRVERRFYWRIFLALLVFALPLHYFVITVIYWGASIITRITTANNQGLNGRAARPKRNSANRYTNKRVETNPINYSNIQKLKS